MDWGAMAVNLVLNLIITAVAYLFIPLVVVLTKKDYQEKTLKKISIINCVIVWIIFRVLQTELTGEPSAGAAVFLWGAVGYSLLKRHCLKEDAADTPTVVPNVQATNSDKEIPVSNKENLCSVHTDVTSSPKTKQGQKDYQNKQFKKYCSRCGKGIDSITKKCTGCGKQYFKGLSVKAVLVTIVCVLLVVSYAGNIILYLANISLREEYDELRTTNSSQIAELKTEILALTQAKENLQTRLSTNAEKIDFLDNHIVVVEDDGTNLYHKYECSRFLGNYFWAFNTEAAESEGYEPCPLCCD